MLTMTPLAVDKIKEIADAEGIGHTSVRIKILGGGCAGFQYDLTYDDKSSNMDEVYNFDEVTVLIDALSSQYLDGVEIAYQKDGFSEGFKFNNPNIKGSCGCGNSFSF